MRSWILSERSKRAPEDFTARAQELANGLDMPGSLGIYAGMQ
jgi:hypothetical protein